MLRKIILAAVAASPLLIAVTAADAAGPAGFARNLNNNAGVQYIKAKARVLAPFAHVKFCRNNPGECAAGSGPATIDFSAVRQSELRRVNATVNRSIRPVNDRSGAGGDVWRINASSGDCEEYALTKRSRLIAMGWSPRALRVAVAYTPSGEGHAVLVVKTSKGDMVLDNRTSAIKNWRQANLRWVKIQSGDNPRQWFSL